MAGERQELMAASPSLWEQAMLLPGSAESFLVIFPLVTIYPPEMGSQLGIYMFDHFCMPHIEKSWQKKSTIDKNGDWGVSQILPNKWEI